MYKVVFTIKSPGFRKASLEGYYIPPDPPPKVEQMKRDCETYIRTELLKHYADTNETDIQLIEFKQMRVNFIYDASNNRENNK